MPRPRWPDVACFGGEAARAILEQIVAVASASSDPRAAVVKEDAVRRRDRRAGSALSCREQCARIAAARAAVRLDPPQWDLAHEVLDDSSSPAPRRRPTAAKAKREGSKPTSKARKPANRNRKTRRRR